MKNDVSTQFDHAPVAIDFVPASDDIGGNGPARTPVQAGLPPKFRSISRILAAPGALS